MPLWSIKKRKEVGREGLIEMGGGSEYMQGKTQREGWKGDCFSLIM